jgi:hypothetical protein
MLMYSPLSAYFDDVIPQHPALSNDGKQGQPALGDFTSPLGDPGVKVCRYVCHAALARSGLSRPSCLVSDGKFCLVARPDHSRLVYNEHEA